MCSISINIVIFDEIEKKSKNFIYPCAQLQADRCPIDAPNLHTVSLSENFDFFVTSKISMFLEMLRMQFATQVDKIAKFADNLSCLT